MKQLAFTVALIASSFSVGSASAQDSPYVPPPAPSPPGYPSANPDDHGNNNQFAIPRGELVELERKALDGDGKAARKVATYFGFYNNDAKSMMYWVRISAEDGDGIEQRFLAAVLDSKTQEYPLEPSDAIKRDKQQRACFWFRKSINNGVKVGAEDTTLQSHCKAQP